MNFYIKAFDNVLPYKTLSTIIKYLNNLQNKEEFHQSKIISRDDNFNFKEKGGNVIKKIRDVNSYNFYRHSQSFTSVHYHNLLANIIVQKASLYQKIHNYCTLHYNVSQIEALRYTEGGHYSLHIDGDVVPYRTLSTILFLNNDYEGGELCFYNDETKEESKVKTVPGRLIMWPSNFIYPHTVKPVTKGIRYTIVSWIC